MKHAFLLMVTLLLSPLNVLHADDGKKATPKPNIVIILADDLGFADVGFNGCCDVATPHIDSLAANGIRFTQGYVTASICSPSRAGLLTGRYQERWGHDSNNNPDLPLSESTLGNRMNQLGYFTGMIGKWHQGERPDLLPPARGFDETFHPDGNAIYFGARVLNTLKSNQYEPATDKTLYTTELNAAHAADFIYRHKDIPFCLYLAFNNVHMPLEVPQKYIDRISSSPADTNRLKMAAMVLALDDAVGVVMEALKQAGLVDNTLVFFLNDNGGVIRAAQKPFVSYNTPFKGGKYTLLEGGIRVPFILQWKAKIPGGRIYDYPVITLDILPTIITAAGGTVYPDWNLDGVNLLPYIEGQVSGEPHPVLYWRLNDRIAIRKGDWKLYRAKATSEIELYNLAEDVSEKNNLVRQYPDKVLELEANWNQWNVHMMPPRQLQK